NYNAAGWRRPSVARASHPPWNRPGRRLRHFAVRDTTRHADEVAAGADEPGALPVPWAVGVLPLLERVLHLLALRARGLRDHELVAERGGAALEDSDGIPVLAVPQTEQHEVAAVRRLH